MANIFPQWSNKVPARVLVVLLVLSLTVVWIFHYYFSPRYTRAGYMPTQPVSFSHAIHVEQLGMDCRYCHTYVDRSEHSVVPDTATCMNCHNVVQANSPAIAPIQASYASGQPIEWVRIHNTPDYVYFNHAVHVNRGISCVHCHGQVNEMEVVWHDKSLSMAFCLECHENPEDYIRPVDKVYDLNWTAASTAEQQEMGAQLVHDWDVRPPISCSGCHR